MPAYCEVVVDRPILVQHTIPAGTHASAIDKSEHDPLINVFTYVIPLHLQAEVQVGQIVEVPFRNGTLQGVIVALPETPPEGIELRPLSAILDPQPVMNAPQFALARWMSRHYIAPLSDCVWLFIPPELRRSPEAVARATGHPESHVSLNAAAATLLIYLQQRGPTEVSRMDAHALATLLEHGLARVDRQLAPPRVGPLIDRTVELAVSLDEAAAALPSLGRQSKQADILLHLAALDNPLPSADEVLAAVGCGPGVLKSLEEKGLVSVSPSQSLVALQSPPGDNNPLSGILNNADPACERVLHFLQSAGRPMPPNQIEASDAILTQLEHCGCIKRWTEPRTIHLRIEPSEVLPAILDLRGTKTEADILDMLAREEGAVWIGWVYAQTDATLHNLRRLAKAGLVALDETRRWRDPLVDLVFVLKSAPKLTADQEKAWRQVQSDLKGPSSGKRPFLLHGVTGSGKTEIYLHAAAEALAQNKGVIILVPEIALATQTIQRVAQRFPNKAAIWHSQLSPGERFDTWQRIRQGKLPLVVGARSALFTPVHNLGLIVVDEEHDAAYKHARSPRIHAREAALALAKMSGTTIILGSATPDVVSMRQVERGRFSLLTLPCRVLAHREHVEQMTSVLRQSRALPATSNIAADDRQTEVCTLPLPPVQIVSLSAELRAGNTSIFSRELQRAMRDTLAAKQQIILFLNRRGTATFILCRDCGYVATCPRCQMPLTYHAEHESLICHHCSRRYPNPQKCPACGSTRIRYFGLGTERVEETVQTLFPKARTVRWDMDTAQARGKHESILNLFAEREADILIGTQMIAKGLDLPFVTLVGVISADTGLFLPDFRAAERTFQVLTQVAGRAGRSPLGGRVIIQTYHPQLPVIQAAAAHDYSTFYRDELESRRNGRYPPFKQLARLIYTGTGADRVQRAAETVAEDLRQHIARRGEPATDVIGPAPCFHSKLRGQYRWHILVRADRPEELLHSFALPLGWQIDIDPTDFL